MRRSVKRNTGSVGSAGLAGSADSVDPVGSVGLAGSVGSVGSASIEAAIALPVFFMVAVSFIFILRVVQVREIVAQALSSAALDIAQSGCIYDMAGLLETQKAAEGLEGRFKDKAVEIVENAYFLDEISEDMPDISAEVGGALDNAYEWINGAVFGMFAKDAVSKYICGELPVVGGFEGLDFSGSTFLHGGDDNVVIRVKYRMQAPPLLSAFSRFEMSQQSCARVWLFGARRKDKPKTEPAKEDEKEEDSVWELGPFERGRKLGEKFGANLPSTFPTINGFSDGEAFTVKSLDTTAATYQNGAALKRTIMGYINKLAAYEGQEKPWNGGGKTIVIAKDSIKSRKIIFVIPTNEIPESTESIIAECVRAGASKGVVVQLERYQEKKVPAV